ncbi:MAG: fold [Acidobacteriales bacterium]|nr:fold [Terriglobales bacterium]
MERRTSSIQAHVHAVERHVNAIKHLQESQLFLRQARRRLHQQQASLSKNFTSKEYIEMLEDLPLPAFIIDRDAGRIVAANALYSKVIGYSQQELIGMPFLRLAPDDLPPIVEKALRSETPKQAIRWPAKRRDGSQISVIVKYRRMKLLCCGKKLNVTYVTVLGWQGDVEIDAIEYYG